MPSSSPTTTIAGPELTSSSGPLQLKSAEDAVFEALRHEILAGLEPDTPLRLNDMAERFDVSTMPVRAALDRLAAEGLVVQRPRRGSVVAPIDLSSLLDIYAIRTGLQSVAARTGVERLTDADIARMQGHLADLVAASRRGNVDLDAYLASEWALHAILYEATGRQALVALIDSYRRQAERYLRLALDRSDFVADLARQQALVAACEQRDAEATEALTRELLQWTVDRLALLFPDEQVDE